MKGKGNGIAVLALLLIGIPLLVDLIIGMVMPGHREAGSLSNILFTGYFFFLPRYAWYLVMVAIIVYIRKQIKKPSNTDHTP